MHSGDAASCRRCWDKTTSLPAQTAKLYRGSNSLASADGRQARVTSFPSASNRAGDSISRKDLSA